MKNALLVCLFAASAVSVPAAEWHTPPTHPRLFIRLDELAALRVRSGVVGSENAGRQHLAFGMYHDDFDRLKEVAAQMMQAPARSDDLFVPAILHLTGGQLGQPDAYTEYVGTELTDPSRLRIGLDGVVALDWCWDALTAETRGRILDRLAMQIEPLDDEQSPLEHFAFTRRLESMAAAVALGEADCRDHPSLLSKLDVIRAEAIKYFEIPFRRFCRERGGMPTSPTSGIWEEADIALACELWRSATGQNLLEELKDTAGRMLDHYFYADTEHPALEHGFIHDDGSKIPFGPASVYRGFAPAVPFVLARYAADPVAAWYAMRSLPLVGTLSPEADRYLWVRLLYGEIETRPAPRKAMPLSRNFGGGWVAMRSGWTPGATALLFDAGQPFWRSRQHYDAGQFQIYRKGRLAIDSGDDVAFQAVPDQGGQTLIDGKPGDWDNFAQATIAHNCITVADQRFLPQQYGRPWPAVGNQRIIERRYAPREGEIDKTPRRTGSLSSFETNSFYSYAAANLGAAYPPEVVGSFSRQVLFVHAGAVVILDRLEAARANSVKTWHLQLPVRPALSTGTAVATRDASPIKEAERVSEAEAEKRNPDSFSISAGRSERAGLRVPAMEARQLHGPDQSAGIWELGSEHEWVSVTNGDGRLFVRTLLPADAQRRLIGGPMEIRTLQTGPATGREFVGGAPFGYEYRLWPASFLRGPNASYDLGAPVGLGSQFGVGSAWGRYDVSPAAPQETVTFLHILVPTDAAVGAPPPVSFEASAASTHLEIILGDQKAIIDLPLQNDAGRVSLSSALTGSVLFEKDLAMQVER